MGAIDVLGARFAALAKKRLDQCKDPEMRKKYEKMVEAFAVIPAKPPMIFTLRYSFFWMLFTFDGIDSPGRLDQYLADYYVRANKAEADDILDRLWDAFHNTRTWNLTIGGSDAQWHDQSNPLTYAILEVTTRKVYHTPNLRSAYTATHRKKYGKWHHIVCPPVAVCRQSITTRWSARHWKKSILSR